MKRLFLSLGIMLSLSIQSIYADKTTNPADVHRWGHESIGNDIHRTPARLPNIYITYDSDVNTIEISCMENHNATVSLYDATGNLIDYSDSLNTVFLLPPSANGTYHIRIESDDWYATGDVTI